MKPNVRRVEDARTTVSVVNMSLPVASVVPDTQSTAKHVIDVLNTVYAVCIEIMASVVKMKPYATYVTNVKPIASTAEIPDVSMIIPVMMMIVRSVTYIASAVRGVIATPNVGRIAYVSVMTRAAMIATAAATAKSVYSVADVTTPTALIIHVSAVMIHLILDAPVESVKDARRAVTPIAATHVNAV